MYSVTYPKNAQIQPFKTLYLKDAIKAKLSLEIDRPSGRAIILDEDGYIVSSREQSLYIIQNLV